MTWQDLLDHLITVEGECMEENYGKGRALNEADEEINAGIRQGYAELLKVRSTLMAAPELLARLKSMVSGAECECDKGDEEHPLCDICWSRQVIAKAEGRSE